MATYPINGSPETIGYNGVPGAYWNSGAYYPLTPEGYQSGWGSGGRDDPNNGTEARSPQEWFNGSRLFQWDTNLEGEWAVVANAVGRSDTPSGLSSADLPQWVRQKVAQALERGIIAATPEGQRFAREYLGYSGPIPKTVGSLGTTGAPGAPGAQGGAGAPWQPGQDVSLYGQSLGPMGTNGLPGGLGLEWHQIAIGLAGQAAEIALNQARLTGMLDGLPTMEKIRLEEEIKARAAEQAVNEARLTGTFNGQPTLEAQNLQKQWQQNEAAITGYYNGQATLDRDRLGLDRDRFGFEQQEAVARAVADPNRLVEGMSLATALGSARGASPVAYQGLMNMQAGATPAAGTPGAYGQAGQAPDLGAPGQSPTQAITKEAQAQNPVLPLAPEVIQMLGAGAMPQFGNPNTPGAFAPLRSIQPAGGSFGKRNPLDWNNMSATGKANYASVGQALTGQRPEDLDAEIKNQLPGRSRGVPGAFAF